MDDPAWNAAPGERLSDPEWQKRTREDVHAHCGACHATSSERWHVTPEGTRCESCWRVAQEQAVSGVRTDAA